MTTQASSWMAVCGDTRHESLRPLTESHKQRHFTVEFFFPESSSPRTRRFVFLSSNQRCSADVGAQRTQWGKHIAMDCTDHLGFFICIDDSMREVEPDNDWDRTGGDTITHSNRCSMGNTHLEDVTQGPVSGLTHCLRSVSPAEEPSRQLLNNFINSNGLGRLAGVHRLRMLTISEAIQFPKRHFFCDIPSDLW